MRADCFHLSNRTVGTNAILEGVGDSVFTLSYLQLLCYGRQEWSLDTESR